MKKAIFYLVSLFVLVGCSDEIPEQDSRVQAKRGILAYMVANNNLDTYIMKNIVWMYQSLAASEDSCTLAIYYKPSSSNAYVDTLGEILLFISDGNGQINGVPALETTQMTTENVFDQAERYTAVSGTATDPNIMAANLRTMVNIVPSQSYGLIFGSHATSWMPASGTLISAKAFGLDGNSSNAINIPELAATLEEVFADNLDFVLFDACMMETAEVCYELRNAVHYCIASVMETPQPGYPYHRILADLYKDEIDFDKVCDAIIAFNQEAENTNWGTYAVVDCTRMDTFASAVAEQISQHASTIENMSDCHAIQQYGVKSYLYFSFDVGDFIKYLNDGTLPDTFQAVLDQTVISKSCITDSDVSPYGSVLTDASRYCGIGMYIPEASDNDTWNAYYESALSWYQAVWEY